MEETILIRPAYPRLPISLSLSLLNLNRMKKPTLFIDNFFFSPFASPTLFATDAPSPPPPPLSRSSSATLRFQFTTHKPFDFMLLFNNPWILIYNSQSYQTEISDSRAGTELILTKVTDPY
ncbi:hypothetical protein ACSBR1_018866 [Camellia fascicularis]